MAEYLPSMARACRCAALHTEGVLEPFYRLHATRLKLLLAHEHDLQLLQQLARCALHSCCLPFRCIIAFSYAKMVVSVRELMELAQCAMQVLL